MVAELRLYGADNRAGLGGERRLLEFGDELTSYRLTERAAGLSRRASAVFRRRVLEGYDALFYLTLYVGASVLVLDEDVRDVDALAGDEVVAVFLVEPLYLVVRRLVPLDCRRSPRSVPWRRASPRRLSPLSLLPPPWRVFFLLPSLPPILYLPLYFTIVYTLLQQSDEINIAPLKRTARCGKIYN